MQSKKKLEERIFLLECINLYKSLPALWNIKSRDYTSRCKKNQQYETLLCKYKERYPQANKTDLVKKFNSLRTNFRKELKKECNTKEEEYKPTLWYFDQMKFLIDSDDLGCCQNGTLNDRESIEINATKLKVTEPQSKKKKPKDTSTDELIRLVTHRSKNPINACQNMGIAWGDKLSKMDRNQRIIAEKIINEVMFNAELGLLNFNTTLTNISSINNLKSSSFYKNNNNNITYINESSLGSTLTLQNSASTSDPENEPIEDNFTLAEYDPLENSIKTED